MERARKSQWGGEAGVYSLGELGQMYGVWRLHKRLPSQVFYDVRRQELASSVGLLHKLRHLLRGLSLRRHSNQHRLGRLSEWAWCFNVSGERSAYNSLLL